MAKIFAYGIRDDEIPALNQWREENPEVTVDFTDQLLDAETAKMAEGYDAVDVYQQLDYTRETLAALHEVGINKMSLRNVGIDNIDLEAAREFGFSISNVPVYSPNAIAEHSMIQMSRLLRRTKALDAKIARHDLRWAPTIGREMRMQTIGIIGTGHIGRVAMKIAQGFGAKIVAYDLYKNDEVEAQGLYVDTLDELYAQADVISLYVPGVPANDKMINAESIAKMKDGVRILNFARGGLVNSADVVAAIEAGKVAAYVTDFPSDDLLGIDGVIAIPHLGASTPESEDNCARMAADELMAYLSDGNIINSVNFPALSSPRAAGCSRVCVFHKNIPSMLSQVTKLLSDKGVNIENMQSKSRKDVAYTVLDCAGQVGQDALESLVDSEGIIRIRVISA